ncbi:hypothetical protein Taro_031610, partial [Colocasia esculenta]|nr:hypothetical protein [Colocasia esculenta]
LPPPPRTPPAATAAEDYIACRRRCHYRGLHPLPPSMSWPPISTDSVASPIVANLADDVELPASSDESVEALSLSKENEAEEVDPEQPEIQLGDFDEEEYTSDENEFDNEDVNAEFDISPTSEDGMENLKIWFEGDVRLLQVGGERVVGGDLLPFLHLHHRQKDLQPLQRYHRQQDPRPLHLYHRQQYLILILTGPMTSTPLPPAAGRLTASASPSHMASGSTPPPYEPVHADDKTSHHEREGSYNETMRAVWINEGYLIHYFCYLFVIMDLLFSMFMRNHRFTEHSDELRARSAWTTTARANIKHLMYNVRRNAERVCANADKNQWKEDGSVWMRKEYWIKLCEIWGGEKLNENSAKAKQNRDAHPKANVHMSGSISFAMHKARLVSTLLHL